MSKKQKAIKRKLRRNRRKASRAANKLIQTEKRAARVNDIWFSWQRNSRVFLWDSLPAQPATSSHEEIIDG